MLDGQVDLRAGMAMDARTSDLHESDLNRDATGGPAQPATFDPERYNGSALGISFPIHGVAFTVDEAVARSYRTGLTNHAASTEDDLPGAGDSTDSLPAARKVNKASPSIHDHIRSDAESRFLSHQLLQVDEWDLRDFKPPEWVGKLRDAVRLGGFYEISTNSPDSPYGSYAYESKSLQPPDPTESKSWIKESVFFLWLIQKHVLSIDPVIAAIVGLISFPFALLGIARLQQGSAPAPAVQIRRVSRRRTATRTRRHRKQAPPLRVNAKT